MLTANSQKTAQVLAMAADIEIGAANPKFSFYNGAVPAAIGDALVAGNKLLLEFDLGANAFEDAIRGVEHGKLYLSSINDVNGTADAGAGTTPTFAIIYDGDGNKKQLWTAGLVGDGKEIMLPSQIETGKAKSLGDVCIQAP